MGNPVNRIKSNPWAQEAWNRRVSPLALQQRPALAKHRFSHLELHLLGLACGDVRDGHLVISSVLLAA